MENWIVCCSTFLYFDICIDICGHEILIDLGENTGRLINMREK